LYSVIYNKQGNILKVHMTCRKAQVPLCRLASASSTTNPWRLLWPKFHYFPTRGSWRNGIWAKGDITGLS